ncbi:unnamed protein product [Ectocarpus sp. CCAP 1310/34]|nr:unnamed protein product [Ectocarpus sp. CCAP 1310/34]
MDRLRADAHGPCLGIPEGYLDSVVVKAYHVDIALAVEEAAFSGLVRIPVHVKPGSAAAAACRTFYLHAAAGLRVSAASVNGVPAVIVRGRATSIEVPEEAAVYGGESAVIEVHFAGLISKLRTDGLYMIETVGKKSDAGAEKAVVGRLRAEGSQGTEQEGGGGGEGETRGQGGSKASIDIRRNGAAVQAVASGGSSSGCSSTPPSSTLAAHSPGIVLGTHLEPTHARELLPCVDLPSSKAVFHLTLRGVPRQLQAISNTPILRTEDETAAADDGGCRYAVKTVVFQPTPAMPTYVFGFWVGDFHCVSAQALMTAAVRSNDVSPPPPLPARLEEEEEEDAVQINVHVVRGVGLKGVEFALEFATRAFELFSKLFSIRFPIPKLDLIGLPQMHGLGMENFGAITCLQEFLVVTPDTTFVRRRRIARLICHEISHMWYGDLVTPHSFDELWLKEGNGSTVFTSTVDALDPSYHVWNNFMSEVFVQAMLADLQENSHPVVQRHDGNIASILESFDTITYCKGASVLRMLYRCVGPDRFLRGMADFVVSHQYRCATQEDLWKAVQGVCDRDGVALDVRGLMQPWLTRPKFPMLRVRMVGDALSITQQPFSFFPFPRGGSFPPPSGVDSAAHRAVSQGGAGEWVVSSEDGAGRSAKVLRMGSAAAGGAQAQGQASPSPPLDDSTRSEGSASAAAEMQVSDDERPPVAGVTQSGSACWAIPLRIRMSRVMLPEDGGLGAAGRGERHHGAGPAGEAAASGKDTHRFLLVERSTSVALRCESADASVGRVESIDSNRRNGGKRPPYMVVNDDHSGFFTVQYECVRSWRLALAAVEQGVLNECETMGFVHDLVIALHEGVLLDRRAACLTIAGARGRGGGGDLQCDVPCLFSRLEEVVRLLDRGHPAWCTGQLFLWELLVMCASNVLGEVYELSRRRREAALVQKRLRDTLEFERLVAVTGGGNSEAGSAQEEGGAPRPHGESGRDCTPEGEGATTVPAMVPPPRPPVLDSEVASAAERLRNITADVERASAVVEGHAEWYAERAVFGEERANEGLQSLRAMQDRLDRSRAQLAWAQQNGVLEAAVV